MSPVRMLRYEPMVALVRGMLLSAVSNRPQWSRPEVDQRETMGAQG